LGEIYDRFTEIKVEEEVEISPMSSGVFLIYFEERVRLTDEFVNPFCP
jgi:hypothetical protein